MNEIFSKCILVVLGERESIATIQNMNAIQKQQQNQVMAQFCGGKRSSFSCCLYKLLVALTSYNEVEAGK